jgi:hypothetical protein
VAAEPIALRPGRTEREALTAAGFAVVLGGAEFRLRPLTMAENRLWIGIYTETLRKHGAKGDHFEGLAGVYEFMADLDPALDLLVAYDVDGAFGGREWIDEHATPDEVLTALGVVREYAIPQLSRATVLVPEHVRKMTVALLEPDRSSPETSLEPTSEPATTGASPRRRNSRRR